MRGAERRAAGAAGLLVAVGIAVALAVILSARPPQGPVAVDWDGARCARCGMLVSDPGFAGQLQLKDGSVRFYDDPGCLLADLSEPALAPLHAVWLHHREQDRWLTLAEAGFAHVPHSPMGYGLAVVDADQAGAVSLEAARRLLQGRVGAAALPEAPR